MEYMFEVLVRVKKVISTEGGLQQGLTRRRAERGVREVSCRTRHRMMQCASDCHMKVLSDFHLNMRSLDPCLSAVCHGESSCRISLE